MRLNQNVALNVFYQIKFMRLTEFLGILKGNIII
jgi:hypothetical protein